MSALARPQRRVPKTRTEVALRVGKATIDGFKCRRTFDGVEHFVFFIGYPHSGSTLVGTLLNGHPDMVISHEADVIRYVRPGLTRNQLFALVFDGEKRFETMGRQWMGIDYSFPAGSQGSFDRLRVVGDKKSGNAAVRLHQDPALLGRLRSLVEVPIRVIHISRNPFDNIASMARSRKGPLIDALDRYRLFAGAVDDVRQRLAPAELMEINYEEIPADPAGRLRELCDFIGVEASDGYLAAGAALVRPSATRSRDAQTWSPDIRRAVEGLIASRPTLRDYSFAD